MLRERIELSLCSYRTALARFQLGEPPAALAGVEEWWSAEEQRTHLMRMETELADLGLLDRTGLRPDFAETLRVLQQPDREFFTWASIGGEQVSIYTGASGPNAAVAVLNGQTLSLYPSTAVSAIADFVARLPKTPAARVPSASCPEHDYRALLAGEPLTQSSHRKDAMHIRQWVDMPWFNAGALYVAIRQGRQGFNPRKTIPEPCGWHDTEAGRILFGVSRDGWLSLTGASSTDIVRRLADLENELHADDLGPYPRV